MSISDHWVAESGNEVRRPSLDWGGGWDSENVPNMRCSPCAGMDKEAVLCGHPGVIGCFSIMFAGRYDEVVYTCIEGSVPGGELIGTSGEGSLKCWAYKDVRRSGMSRLDVAFYTEETPEDICKAFKDCRGVDCEYQQFAATPGWTNEVYHVLVTKMLQYGLTPPPIHK